MYANMENAQHVSCSVHHVYTAADNCLYSLENVIYCTTLSLPIEYKKSNLTPNPIFIGKCVPLNVLIPKTLDWFKDFFYWQYNSWACWLVCRQLFFYDCIHLGAWYKHPHHHPVKPLVHRRHLPYHPSQLLYFFRRYCNARAVLLHLQNSYGALILPLYR